MTYILIYKSCPGTHTLILLYIYKPEKNTMLSYTKLLKKDKNVQNHYLASLIINYSVGYLEII